jgi:hypothetical protein
MLIAASIYDIFHPYNRVQLNWHHISSAVKAKRVVYVVHHNIYLDILANHFKIGNIVLNEILLAGGQAISKESEDELQRAVNRFESIENDFNISISTTKTKTLLFRERKTHTRRKIHVAAETK